jgi:hypothetical protein
MDAHTTLQMSKHTDFSVTSRAHTQKTLLDPKRKQRFLVWNYLVREKAGPTRFTLRLRMLFTKPLPGGQLSNMNSDVRSLTKAIHVLKYIHVPQRNTIRYDKVWARRRVITALLTKKKWKITYMLSKWRYFKLIKSHNAHYVTTKMPKWKELHNRIYSIIPILCKKV